MLVLGRVLLCISSHWNFPHEVSISFSFGESSYLQRLQWKNTQAYQGNFPILVWRHPFFHCFYQPTSTHFLEDFTHYSASKISKNSWDTWNPDILYEYTYLYQFLPSAVGYHIFLYFHQNRLRVLSLSALVLIEKNWYELGNVFSLLSDAFNWSQKIGMWPTTCRWCKQLLEGNDDWRVPRFPVSRDRKTRDRNGDLCKKNRSVTVIVFFFAKGKQSKHCGVVFVTLGLVYSYHPKMCELQYAFRGFLVNEPVYWNVWNKTTWTLLK